MLSLIVTGASDQKRVKYNKKKVKHHTTLIFTPRAHTRARTHVNTHI